MNANRIDPEFRKFLLGKIINDWSTIPPNARSNTFWVAEHETTDDPSSPIDTPVVGAWYFDGREFHDKPISDVLAFLNLALGYPSVAGCFDVGIAGFAPIEDSKDSALFWQFGGLMGMGYRCTSSGESYSCDEAWRS